eukprot:c17594_g1_i1.p1 GENE.c17594_g1_i1~~c17594_g1_i1.p1  ORF type:complete len:757 (+),score=189.01 c17594_g1_i1:131-2272(+)
MDPPVIKNDVYFWLRDDDRKRPDVIEYLEKENEYTEHMTAHLKDLQESVYQEMKSYLKETDDSCPYPWGPFEWYTRTVEGLSYKIHCRRPKAGGEEEVVLDINQVAKDLTYCEVGDVDVSPLTYNLCAYSVDKSGYETFNIVIKNLATGELLDEIPETDGNICWDKTEQSIFYTTQDKSHRPYKLFRHILGTPLNQDECLFTEDDERFWLNFSSTRSGRFLIVQSSSPETGEVHLLDLDELQSTGEAKLRCIEPRVSGRLYSVDHHSNTLFIVTNADGAKNFKLVTAPLSSPDHSHWVDVPAFAHSPARTLDSCACFASHIVVVGREDGLTQCWIAQLDDTPEPTKCAVVAGEVHRLSFDEPVYTVARSTNREYDAEVVRIEYSSLTAPKTVLDYGLREHNKTVRKVQEVPGYRQSDYSSKRFHAVAADGRLIPISIVYHTKLFEARQGQPGPLLLYGYGSYGISIDPTFDFKLQPLLNRGVVHAVAHIRGGGEMGRGWYEDEGKYLTKRNTFTDFIACAEHLFREGLTTPNQMAIEGRSAGGLLVGAVLNLRPDLCTLAVAGVPFVDVMTTMRDPSIPLTVTEWEEWGNPNSAKFYEYMLSYSPVDNVHLTDSNEFPYPSILITAGLHDPRVAYWEPAKWVARLRDAKIQSLGGSPPQETDPNPIMLKIDLSAGHFSASDRYKYLRVRSFEFSVLLDRLGLNTPPLNTKSLM